MHNFKNCNTIIKYITDIIYTFYVTKTCLIKVSIAMSLKNGLVNSTLLNISKMYLIYYK